MYRMLLLTLTLSATPTVAGEPSALDLGKKLVSLVKVTELSVKPFLSAPEETRLELFKHFDDLRFSDDNRAAFAWYVLKKDTNEDVRLAAFDWLARMPQSKLAAKMWPMFLGDKSPALRAAAAKASAEARDPLVSAKLAKLLGDESRDVRLAAVQGLGKMNDRKSVPAILSVYKKDGKNDDGDVVFAEALGMLGESDVSLEIARRCLKSRKQPVRVAAINALSFNRNMKVIPAIMENLVFELRNTVSLDSSKPNWDYVYVTMCGELQQRVGKNYGNNAIGWIEWWEGVRESYMAPAPLFERTLVGRWMEQYTKMGPTKVKD